MIEGIIYKYTSPSGKVYIGQTINKNSRRCDFLNPNKEYAGPKINRARAKYGPSNFKYEILEEIEGEDIKELLNELEIKYIKFFDSINNGYNISTGGQESFIQCNSETVLLIDLTSGSVIAEYESLAAASRATGGDRSSISKVCKGIRDKCAEFGWRYKYPRVNKECVQTNFGQKAVLLYDLQGNLIQEFESASAATRALGKRESHISACCRGERATCLGFKWKYKNN